jgi:rhamnose utilization protein RhaD (predicted bifunctional aldolase and dehydrogenase)
LATSRSNAIRDLLNLSREIGREDRGLAIVGEGNTSARLSRDTFLVKASGARLVNLAKDEVVECRISPLVALLEKKHLTDEQIDDALLAARVDQRAKKPSLEAVFHAWLISLPDVNFVGHAHATTINQVLCSPRAREFAERRMIPDEGVCCGVESVFVPYTDPGLNLAKAIRRCTEAFIRKHQHRPRVVLMQNHGIITMGPTTQSVLSTMMMSEKSARVFVGAAVLGGPVFLSKKIIRRFAGRPDEAYRTRALKL